MLSQPLFSAVLSVGEKGKESGPLVTVLCQYHFAKKSTGTKLAHTFSQKSHVNNETQLFYIT